MEWNKFKGSIGVKLLIVSISYTEGLESGVRAERFVTRSTMKLHLSNRLSLKASICRLFRE